MDLPSIHYNYSTRSYWPVCDRFRVAFFLECYNTNDKSLYQAKVLLLDCQARLLYARSTLQVLSLSLSLSLSLFFSPLSLSHSLSRSLARSLACSLSPSLPFSPSLPLPLSLPFFLCLCLSRARALSLSLSGAEALITSDRSSSPFNQVPTPHFEPCLDALRARSVTSSMTSLLLLGRWILGNLEK